MHNHLHLLLLLLCLSHCVGNWDLEIKTTSAAIKSLTVSCGRCQNKPYKALWEMQEVRPHRCMKRPPPPQTWEVGVYPEEMISGLTDRF